MRDVHMLIRSCLFYYQFCASIPLQMGMDGLAACGTRCRSQNGIRPLPGVHHPHQAYFAAENASNDVSASTILIEFMKALIDRIEPPEKPSTTLRFRANPI